MKSEPIWRRYLRFWGPDPASDVEDELRFHIRTKTDELIADGMNPADARREARRRFGPIDTVRRECYVISKGRHEQVLRREYFGGWLRDVQYAVRLLLKAKVSTAIAILTLALGIGGDIAVFTFLDRLLYAPLPVPKPSQLQLVSCSAFARFSDGSRVEFGCRYDAYTYLRDWNHTFSGLAATGGLRVRERRGKEKIDRPAEADSVSGNFFGVLGRPAILGRVLAPSDDAPGALSVAVASYRFWSRRYNRDADVLGRVVYLNNLPFTIVGVLPRGFTGLYKGSDPDLYVPLGSQPRLFGGDVLDTAQTNMFGRLRPGVPPQQATADLQAALAAYLAAAPQLHGRPQMEAAGARIECEDGARGIAGTGGEKKRSLLLLGGIVALLLIMACVNVACLLVARGVARQQEIAIRVWLGAGKARILRQSLIESCLLTLAGGAAGLFTALWADRLLLIAFQWKDRPLDLSPDWRVLAFGLAVSLVTGLLVGSVPAIQFLRGGRVALNQGRTVAPGFASGRALVVVEVALSLVMVAGAAVFVHSFRNLRSVPVGFSPEHVSAITLSNMGDPHTIKAPVREATLLAESLRGAPGVESTTVADLLTFDDSRISFPLSVPGDPTQPARQPNLLRVDGNYFDALRIPLVAGRTFSPHDDQHAPKVAVLSDGTARRLFGSQNPLGRRILIGRSRDPKPEDEVEVVGVVKDIKFTNVTRPSPDVVFAPLFQEQNIGARSGSAKLQVRSRMAPQDVAALVRAQIRAQGLPVTVESASALEDAIGASMLNDRLRMQASSLFGAVALLLITAGIYGLMAFSVARRRREIGIRIAVGARPAAMVQLVLKESLRLVLIGVLIGIPGAIAVMRAVADMLFGLSPIDPASLGVAAIALCLSGVAASVVPAWRAARQDPVQALRVE